MDPDPRSDEQLMQDYVEGDAAAFEHLHARLQPWLLRVMELHLARREDARDLVQQTFLQAHRARRDFRPGARLRPWLVTIALNLKRGYLRRWKRRPEGALPDLAAVANGGPSPERRAGDAQLREALDRLPTPQREVLVLHYFGGLSFGEIATQTGTGLSAVKQRARRAYAALRVALGGDT